MTDTDYSKYDEAFENAEEPLLGKFPARVKKLEFSHSRQSGTPMVVWMMKSEKASHNGRGFSKYAVFTTNSQIMGLHKHELKIVGVKWSNIETLKMNLQLGEGALVEVTRERNGKYINTYINKRLAEPKPTDEKAPF